MATSSFQIEGAADERSPSIWDTFCREPGRIEDGRDGRIACDHVHRWREDVDLLGWLGVSAYRFSVSWPRIFPEGRGPVSTEGLDFYDRLVDALLERGIRPFLTLYHWDLPQVLEERGGWRTRDTASAFVELTTVVARRLGDRVRHFCTHNEPWCAAMLGHHSGVHAPGHTDLREALAAGHHILLSHGWSTQGLRAEAPRAEVGIVQLVSPGHPASSSAADLEALRIFDGEFNRWFVEPPALGSYPPDIVERYLQRGILDDRHPVVARPQDLADIAAPTDFLGINYYSRTIVRAEIPEAENAPRALPPPPPEALTDMGWEVHPDGLREILLRAHQAWGARRIYVTENGAAYGDGPDADGEIRDARRRRYLERHFDAAAEAIRAGVPLAGYFVWSLLDNFEWAFGYSKRFGLFWVDFESLERKPKQSARWLRSFLRETSDEDPSS